MHFSSFARGLFAAVICTPILAFAAPSLTVSADNPSGIFSPGQKIVWHVAVSNDPEHIVNHGSYVLKKAGLKTIGEGKLSFGDQPAIIEASLNVPGTVLAEIDAPVEGGATELKAYAGAAVAPEKLQLSIPAAADFDAFWKSKIEELASVPENPVLEKAESGKAGIDYWKITMDNIRGTHIRGQLARPAGKQKLPAMLVLQWAGIYPLKKEFVLDSATKGWLVLNINAHDLPIDESKEFYDAQTRGPMKDYPAIGNADRETSYFLRMFLACYRSVEYLSERSDWNGKTLVVTGVSQGGLQTLVAAGLNPKVTAIMINVPAGCDNNGAIAERNPGWPYWKQDATGRDEAKVMDTSRYFDGVNFAARIHCPALIGLGLIDVTAPPSGVFSAVNQIKARKEVLVMPDSPHHNVNNTQHRFYDRFEAWRSVLAKGAPAPVQPVVALDRSEIH